jgi:PST family polysaccharide transporter
MIIGLMASAVMFAVRSVVMQQLGPEAVGYFQSAFGLSGMYAGYILGAMGTDFLPRLSAVSSDHDTVNQLVNEQTEVALLLGLPGVLGTILFAPLIIPFFYSAEFAAAVPVLQLMSVGVFGRLVSWPMSFVVIAKNEMRLSLIAESLSNAVHLAVVVVSLRWLGVAGTGWASILSYVVFTVALYVSLSKLTQFKWTPGVRRVLVGGLLVITATIASEWTLAGPWKWGVSISIWCVTSLLCLRSLIVAARVTQPGIVRRLKSWFGKGPADASS